MTSAANGDLPQVALPKVPSYPVLKDQKALVTGAGSGIGKAVALAMGSAGAAVAVNYRAKEEEARAIVDEIEAAGGEAFAVQGDVSREEEVQRCSRRRSSDFGTLDILVNNAGLQQRRAVRGDDAGAVEQGARRQPHRAVPLRPRGGARVPAARRGRAVSCAAGKIVCISSVHEVIPWAGHVNYAASKGGVMLMMKAIAQEVAPHRIRVNSDQPGRDPHADQPRGLGTPEAVREAVGADPLRAHRRARGRRPRGRLAGLRRRRLRHRRHALRRRRHDAVSLLRRGRLSAAAMT